MRRSTHSGIRHEAQLGRPAGCGTVVQELEGESIPPGPKGQVGAHQSSATASAAPAAGLVLGSVLQDKIAPRDVDSGEEACARCARACRTANSARFAPAPPPARRSKRLPLHFCQMRPGRFARPRDAVNSSRDAVPADTAGVEQQAAAPPRKVVVKISSKPSEGTSN